MPRMLVVDDDPAWRALYRMAFEDRFEIFEATDGQQGLSVLDSVSPNVILLDLRMPKMDGLDFIRRVALRGSHPPIVVCSGTLNEGERPAIPGVQLTPKTPDLRDLWAALRTAVPEVAETTAVTKPTTVPVEETLWRD
jgi:two-component system nitrogen regulation response regulator NtrX